MDVTKERAGVGRLAGLRVLIVEDSWLIADTLAVVLESEGARVVGPAAAGGRAISLLRQEIVDIALVDMSLSDGFADGVIEELDSRLVPYFIVTGFGALPTNADAFAIAVVRKPEDAVTIVELISNFVTSAGRSHV